MNKQEFSKLQKNFAEETQQLDSFRAQHKR